MEAVASCHGFADGNKRTAVILTRLLIDQSGYDLVLDYNVEDDEALEDLTVCVVAHVVEGEEIVCWFRDRLIRR